MSLICYIKKGSRPPVRQVSGLGFRDLPVAGKTFLFRVPYYGCFYISVLRKSVFWATGRFDLTVFASFQFSLELVSVVHLCGHT